MSDESAEALRRLAGLGLFPGTRIRVTEEPGGEATRIRVEGSEIVVEDELARTVFVEPDDAGATGETR